MQFTNIRGRRSDKPTAEWFLAVEDRARTEGLCKVDLDLFQIIGNAGPSAGTHSKGGAVDCWESKNPTRLLTIMRNAGGAAWFRTRPQFDTPHIHVGLKGMSPKPYDSQIKALERGRNGLADNGPDTGPRAGIRIPLVSWREGLDHLRADSHGSISRDEALAGQKLRDFWNPWIAIDAWDAVNPDDATLTGMSDETLRGRFIEHGFSFYRRGDLHEEMRVTLADFAASRMLTNIERKPDEVAFDLLNQLVAKPPSDVTWVELRPVFDAAHAGGTPGPLGSERTEKGVKAVQEGLNHFGARVVVDGDYGPQTRAAVAEWQVALRGARRNTLSADGIVGVHDFCHLVQACSARKGHLHRPRFLY